jgi:sarcosine oxidase subunit beta
MKVYDAAVIGSGLVGLATAYELCRAGAKVALIEAGALSSGSSSANTGLLEYEGEDNEVLFRMSVDGLEANRTLEEELGRKIDFSSIPFLALLTGEADTARAEKSAAFYSARGFDYRLVSNEEIRKMDSLLNMDGVTGGALFTQWRFDPLRTVYAYFAKARELGMDWLHYSAVTGFKYNGNTINAAVTRSGEIRAENFIVAAGAWTRDILKTINFFLPEYYIQGSAMVMEYSPGQRLDHVITFFHSPRVDMERRSAVLIQKGGWETIPEQNADEFVISPDVNGNYIIAQRSFVLPGMKAEVPLAFLAEMSSHVYERYPSFSKNKIIRSWISPVPFTIDGRGYFGFVKPFHNLAVSSGYASVLIMAPILGKMGADLLLHRSLIYDIDFMDPNRFDLSVDLNGGTL